MIVFEEIKWKNFLSTGNSFTEIQIDDAPSHLILGSNGAGKSTLMNILFGLYRPDEGSIHMDGKMVDVTSPEKSISLGIVL